MRWFRRRSKERSEATKARERAEIELERVRAETQEYVDLGNSLRDEIRGRNHLTDLFLSMPRGKR